MSELMQTTFSSDATFVNSQEDIYISEVPQRICLVGSILQNDQAVHLAAEKLSLPVVYSENGLEYAKEISIVTFFVLDQFLSQEFDNLLTADAKILGRPAFLEMANSGSLVYRGRPHYCNLLKDCSIVFTCFKTKYELGRLLKLVNYMGGSVYKELKSSVTHLVAYACKGDKYQYAVTFEIPVMGGDWLNALWAHRDESEITVQDKSFDNYKVGPFYNCSIAFHGFSDEDATTMKNLVENNNGFVTSMDDPNTTHVVIDDRNVSERPNIKAEKCYVVKAEWFWSSVQMDAGANEKVHEFKPIPNVPTPNRNYYTSTPGSRPGSRSRGRKRLRDSNLLQQLAENDSPQGLVSASKRRSSVTDLAYMSSDASMLDDSSHIMPVSYEILPTSPPVVDLRNITPRQRVFQEIVKTEFNYVNILDNIIKDIKKPLEEPYKPGEYYIDPPDVKYIFGNIPPIQEVHTKLKNELMQLAHKWDDNTSIGKIILSYTSEMEKTYPPFVNYFENVKEILHKLVSERPRFQGFLKLAEAKKEFYRQSLQELLIRPIQRLPSMSLLLADLLKHTDKSHCDHSNLYEALEKIKSIMTLINDDKRKTEEKLKLFEIHNEIDNCPPNLVASYRTYINHVDVTELSEICSGGRDSLTLFLFNDVVEICKKKSKYNTIKSPGKVNAQAMRSIKSYKHVELLSLTHVKRVIDFEENDDLQNVFGLIIKRAVDLEEKLYIFQLASEKVTKYTFMKIMCSHMASVMCRSDVENFLAPMDPKYLGLSNSDMSGTLTKVRNYAAKTKRKVSRALSFNNKSPGRLKRAVSTVMSPFNGGQHALRAAASVRSLAHEAATPNSTPKPRNR